MKLYKCDICSTVLVSGNAHYWLRDGVGSTILDMCASDFNTQVATQLDTLIPQKGPLTVCKEILL